MTPPDELELEEEPESTLSSAPSAAAAGAAASGATSAMMELAEVLASSGCLTAPNMEARERVTVAYLRAAGEMMRFVGLSNTCGG